MKKFLSLLLVMLMTASLTACGGSSSSGSNDSSNDAASGDDGTYTKVSLSLAHGAAETTTMNQSMIYLKEIVEERSGGAVTIDLYPNQQLGADRETTEAVTQGNISIACPSSSPVASFVPELNVLDSPWVFTSLPTVRSTL